MQCGNVVRDAVQCDSVIKDTVLCGSVVRDAVPCDHVVRNTVQCASGAKNQWDPADPAQWLWLCNVLQLWWAELCHWSHRHLLAYPQLVMTADHRRTLPHYPAIVCLLLSSYKCTLSTVTVRLGLCRCPHCILTCPHYGTHPYSWRLNEVPVTVLHAVSKYPHTSSPTTTLPIHRCSHRLQHLPSTDAPTDYNTPYPQMASATSTPPIHRCPHWLRHPYPQIPSLAKTHTLSTYSLFENETSLIRRCLHGKKHTPYAPMPAFLSTTHTLSIYAFPAHDTHTHTDPQMSSLHTTHTLPTDTFTLHDTHPIHRCLHSPRHTPYPQMEPVCLI